MSDNAKLREIASNVAALDDFGDVWSDAEIGGRSIVCRDHAAAQYIIAASPIRVIALLDELDATKAELEELNSRHSFCLKSWEDL